MLHDFPSSFEEAFDWGWAEFVPYAQELLRRKISPKNLSEWLTDESQFLALIHELNGRLSVAVDQNTDDQSAKDRLNRFRDQVWFKIPNLTNQFEQKLIDTDLTLPDYEIQFKRIRNNLEIYHPENTALEIEEKKLCTQYKEILGKMKLEVNGQNQSIFDVLRMLHLEPDRPKRETIFRNILAARVSVSDAYDAIWEKLFAIRQKIAHNAGTPDYMAYMWQKLNRHDYCPNDVVTLCEAIESVVVPVVKELRHQQAIFIGLDSLKPWDKTVEVKSNQMLKPYKDKEEWLDKSRRVFNKISPRFGEHFDTMQREGLLDLESRPNKSPWNYAERLPASNRSFIFINGRGGNADLFMLFHEFGHAVHKIEMSELPYLRQKMLPEEISEVASTTMELLAGEYLSIFYTPEQAQIVRHNHLANMLTRWPFVAMVTLFQHWAYTHPNEGIDPAACDHYWLDLYERFMPGIDSSGFEDDLKMQWREFFQVFVFPFYAIEYAFAQLGAVQIWQNYLRNPQVAIEQFLNGLRSGHTTTVQAIYALAGAKFSSDSKILKQAVETLQNAMIQ